MKPALLIPAVVTALLAASPALACRVRPDIPPSTPVAFTAVVEGIERERAGDNDRVTAQLRIRERIDGRITDTLEVEGLLSRSADVEEIVISCGSNPNLGRMLADLPEGGEVVVVGRQGLNDRVSISAIVLADSPRGRTLLAGARQGD